MGKYLDKTGLQYFYNKLKEKFADKTTIDAKLESLTGALTWKGKKDTLPTDLTDYSAGNVIAVGTKEYVCTEVNGVKSWDELGDEGSYLLKTTAEETYLKKANGEVKTANLADGNVTKAKLATDIQTSLGKADNSVQLYACNPAKTHYPTVFLDDDYYGCLEVRDASDTDVMMTSKPYVSIRKNAVYVRGKEGDRMSRNVIVDADGMKIGGKDMGNHFIGIGENNKLKIGGTSSTSKETLGGVATPVEDTDAANKAYVDEKVNLPIININSFSGNTSKVVSAAETYGVNGLFHINFSDEIPDNYAICDGIGFIDVTLLDNVPKYATMCGYASNIYADETNMFFTINAIGDLTFYPGITDLSKYKADKSTLATSLQAITIYTDNTTEHKAQNLANIKAYEDNLKAMGVDVTTGWTAPVIDYADNFTGILSPLPYGNYILLGSATSYGKLYIMQSTGAAIGHFLLDSLNTYSSLTTTSKRIIPAINEVNDEIGYKQDKYDDSLATNNKTIVEAINENTDDIGVLSGSMANCIKTNEDAVLNGVLINDDINFKVTGKEGSFISIRTTGVDGELEFGSDVDQVTLKNISAPDDELDAANKAYVDSKVSDIYKPIYVDRNLIDLDVNSTVTPLAWDAIKSAIGKGLIINGTMDSTSEETIAANKYNYGINANVNAKYLKVESTIGGTPSLRLASVAVSFMDEDDTYRKITFDSSGKITAKATKNIFDSTTVANQLAQI